MVMCAKFNGRPVSACTRGEGCVCLKERFAEYLSESSFSQARIVRHEADEAENAPIHCRHPQCRNDSGDCEGACAETDRREK
jgi:hypothetical protein